MRYQAAPRPDGRCKLSQGIPAPGVSLDACQQSCCEPVTAVACIPPKSHLSAQLTQRHQIHGGQLQLRQRSPGSGGNRQIGASFVVAKTQGAICDPLRNQHHQHSNQAIELHKATRQWMQTTRGLGLGNGGHAARGDQSLPTLPGRFDQTGGSGQIARVPLRRGALTCAGGLGEGSRQRNGRS